jgi:DNA invertase Pin-like site-specific DNA recombinase
MSDEDQAESLTRAAQYLRMSTDHQRYSLINQRAAIAEYAERQGYRIVETYSDPGKSGLSLKGRDGLKQLLSDVLLPSRSFDAILILDVSRWGRFQDTDQAAHYEFLCRQAGVAVIYCAEPFENDNSFTSSILKNLKRVMAAEFLREHSAKLTRAHLQQARLGFKQGGTVVYGFRRQLQDYQGNVRGLLEPGQYKAISSDRVVVVPGPVSELDVIRRIFKLFVHHEFGLKDIAAKLRAEGILAAGGKPWTDGRVRTVLGSEQCIGIYRYNRRSSKLQSPIIKNPEALWVRGPARAPVVSRKLFQAAQDRLSRVKGGGRYRDKIMLNALKRLLEKEGRLSTRLMVESPVTPDPDSYKKHFGSLLNAFNRIGYKIPARRQAQHGGHHWTESQILAALRKSYAAHGYLTQEMMRADKSLPSPSLIQRKFGSLPNAFQAAGLPCLSRSEIQKDAYLRRREREARKPAGGNFREDGALIKPKFTPEDILVRLAQLLRAHGYLSTSMLNHDPYLPTADTIRKRFGTLTEAYAAAGWTPTRQEIIDIYYRQLDPLIAKSSRSRKLRRKRPYSRTLRSIR